MDGEVLTAKLEELGVVLLPPLLDAELWTGEDPLLADVDDPAGALVEPGIFVELISDETRTFVELATDEAGAVTESEFFGDSGPFVEPLVDETGMFVEPTIDEAGVVAKPEFFDDSGGLVEALADETGMFVETAADELGVLVEPLADEIGTFVGPAADEPGAFGELTADELAGVNPPPIDVACPTEDPAEPVIETPMEAKEVEILIEGRELVPRPGVEPPSAA